MGCAAAAAVDYAFYRDTYGGGMGVEAFSEALPAAERHVCWLAGGREPTCEADELAWRRAVCATAEAFAEFGEGQVGGFQIGSFSVTHYDNRGTIGEEQATYACEKELAGTGLLFCGAR